MTINVQRSGTFKTDFKKLDKRQQEKTLEILRQLGAGAELPFHFIIYHGDHIRDTHVLPDLILLYTLNDEIISENNVQETIRTIILRRIANHSVLFR